MKQKKLTIASISQIVAPIIDKLDISNDYKLSLFKNFSTGPYSFMQQGLTGLERTLKRKGQGKSPKNTRYGIPGDKRRGFKRSLNTIQTISKQVNATLLSPKR